VPQSGRQIKNEINTFEQCKRVISKTLYTSKMSIPMSAITDQWQRHQGFELVYCPNAHLKVAQKGQVRIKGKVK